jgi:hypothetical protein
MNEPHQGSDGLHGDDRLVLGLFQGAKIGMAAGGHAAKHPMLGAHGEGRGRVGEQSAPGIRAARQDPSRDPVGERRLADALGPRDQPGMRKAPRLPSLDDEFLRRAVTEQIRVLDRWGWERGFVDHETSPPRAIQSSTVSRSRAETTSSGPVASTTFTRRGSRAAMSKKAARSIS